MSCRWASLRAAPATDPTSVTAVVSELLQIVEGLREQGQTMIIVEQSLNVAAAIAERAVGAPPRRCLSEFIEKGHVRFDGSTRELAARGDIARAVLTFQAATLFPDLTVRETVQIALQFVLRVVDPTHPLCHICGALLWPWPRGHTSGSRRRLDRFLGFGRLRQRLRRRTFHRYDFLGLGAEYLNSPASSLAAIECCALMNQPRA